MKLDVLPNTTTVSPMTLSNAFLIGCDENQEWMLSWFLKNYKKHNKTPLIFADFGLTDTGRAIARGNADHILDFSAEKGKGWFLKPKCMWYSPAKKTVWLDLDCEIRGDLSPIFDLLRPDMLNMVEDVPWSNRRGEVWHNSGVVGFVDKPIILKHWMNQVEKTPQVGDQEVLHSLLTPITKLKYINDLPRKYNTLRIDFIDDTAVENPAVIHWTGQKGKDEIRRQIDA